MKRKAFYISDRTGITVEALAKSLLTQFEGVTFDRQIIPYVDTVEKVRQVVERINAAADADGVPPLIFSSMVDVRCRNVLEASKGVVMDFFGAFIAPLEKTLGVESSYNIGRVHTIGSGEGYDRWIDAVNFALSHDDGQRLKKLDTADLILVGVSRSGKTPTSLYLAMQFGIRAANYPITDDDFDCEGLPEVLKSHKKILFGLTISPQRLSNIRQERKPDSHYASLAQCRKEVQIVERMFKREKVPFLNTTAKSIEELASGILVQTGLKRRAAVTR
ncbi:Phosphoenolpyruvate synthase regulatory protein [hydrothermal vent metagenome]|uniref:Phosphoenolpyruvate synthase regulatory protein n=1 Tax=hydrothermal vent metagenome TaxID=652676 RepID=A0A3B1BKZ9_9ZZZZ